MKRLKTIKESIDENDLKALLEKEPPKQFIDWVNATAKEKKIDMTGIDMRQLAAGIEVEREHDNNDDIDVVKEDADLLKIAVAHLREEDDYYTVLLDAGL